MANKMVFNKHNRTFEIELFTEEDLTQHKWNQFVDVGRLHDPRAQEYDIPCRTCGHVRGKVHIHAKNGAPPSGE